MQALTMILSSQGKLKKKKNNTFFLHHFSFLILLHHSLLFLLLRPPVVTGGIAAPAPDAGVHPPKNPPRLKLKRNRKILMESKGKFPTFLLFGFRDIGLQRRLTHQFEPLNTISNHWARSIKSTSSRHFVNKDAGYQNQSQNQNQNQIQTVSKTEGFPKKSETKATEQKMESFVMPPRVLKPKLYQLGRRQFSKRDNIRFTRGERVRHDLMLQTKTKEDKVMGNRTRRRRRETSRKYKKYGKIKPTENGKNKEKSANKNINKSSEYSHDESHNKNNNIRTSPEIAEFERFVTQVMSCRQIPALSVALVQKGVPLLARAFGVADFEKSKKATAKTKFFIASLTKSFTSTVIARVLSERRDLTWNTAIHQYLPDFRLPGKTRTEQSTLRDLLGHRTGICGLFRPLLYGFPEEMTRKEFVDHIRFQPICNEFRDRFLYNNYMYVLAAHVTEQLTNQTWEELVMCHLLRPMGMKDTGFADHVESFEDFALPYVRNDGKFTKLAMEVVKSVTPAGPAGSMYSTPGDMLKWMQLHLNLHSNFNSVTNQHPKKNSNVKSKSKDTNLGNKTNSVINRPRSNLIADSNGRLNSSVKSESIVESHNSISDSKSDFKCKSNSDTILNAAQLGIDPHILIKTHEAVSPKPQLVPDLTRAQFPIDDVFVSYNMGWITSMYRGFKRLWHSGSIPPYGSVLHLFPEVDSGIFISVNGPLGMDAYYALSTIAWRGGDLLLGIEPWLNTTTACTFPQPWEEVSDTEGSNCTKCSKTNLSSNSNQNDSTSFDSSSQQRDSNTTSESIIQDSSSSKNQNLTVGQFLDLTGDYIHLAFGLMQVRFNSSSKKLNLHFGRYGHLLLTPTLSTNNETDNFNEEAYNHVSVHDKGTVSKFEAINMGPFWFLSSSDDGHERLSVKFCRHAGITKLWFPLGSGDPVAFIRNFQKQTSSLAGAAIWDINYLFKYLPLYFLLLLLFR